MTVTRTALLSLALLSFSTLAWAETDAIKPAAFGEEVGKLEVVDIRYLPRTLDDFGDDREAYVLFFTTVECPLVNRYLPKLAKLERAYRKQKVQFVAVDVGPGDELTEIATQAIESGAAFPFVKDFDQTVARRLGVDRTATVVVLDADQKLRYRGRIDDQYRFGGVRPKATRDDLKLALDAVLAKTTVAKTTTAVDGCKVTPPPPPVIKGKTPTFAQDVAPIFDKNCVSCHRPGTEAPFSLINYAKAKDNAEMIAEVVRQGRMPPWFASKKHGTWKNARRLTPTEKLTIRAWAAAGAPAGDLKTRAAPPTFSTSKWAIPQPDLVLKVRNEAKLPAHGYVNYKYEILPHLFGQDTWVSHIQIRPRNRRVLHHANLAYIPPGSLNPRHAKFITGQVPGGQAMILEPGLAVKIPKGAMLVLQIHYVTTGKPETDQLEVGLRFPRWTIKKQLHHVQVRNTRFSIPPHAPAHRVSGRRTLKHNARGLTLFSHMHLRGRDMQFTATYPDGKQERLLTISNYSFDWQLAYHWQQPKRFPKGTRLDAVAHFDNSRFNPFNPDASKTVRFGEQTFHEMHYGFFFYTDEDEQLALRVDPKTGFEVGRKPAKAKAPKPKKAKRYFK